MPTYFGYNQGLFGQQNYSGVFTPAKPGQKLTIPQAKPFSYSHRSTGPRLEVPNQNPSPLGPPPPAPTLADKLASLNLPGLVERLGLQNQLTRPQCSSQYANGMAGRSMTEEQAIGRERLAEYERQKEENRRKYAGLIEVLRRMGIVDSSRLVETND